MVIFLNRNYLNLATFFTLLPCSHQILHAAAALSIRRNLMKIPVTSNLEMIPQNTSLSTKQSASTSPETSFSHALSREIVARRHADENSKTTMKDPENNTHAASTPLPPTTPSVGKKEATATQETPATADKNKEEAPGIPAEMLALVANLNQAAATPAEQVVSDGLSDTLNATDPEKKSKNSTKDLLESLPTADPGAKGSLVTQKNIESGQAGKFAAALDLTLIADKSALREPVDLAIQKQEIPPELTAIATPSLQQVALNTAQVMASHPTEKLTPHVGTSAWDQALGQKVVWMIAGAEQSATLTLNPPDLGPLQIVLNVSDTQASASFTSAQPEVRQAIEAAMPKLREMLNDAGIQLGQTSVNAGTPNQQGSAFGQAAQQNTRSTGKNGDTGDMGSDTMISGRNHIGGQGLINTFA
jgi:flagellar hook-length control protein FliK